MNRDGTLTHHDYAVAVAFKSGKAKMSHDTSFDDVLNAVDQLSTDEQEALLEVVQHRMAERRRKLLAAEIAEAQQELANGGCRPATPDELLNEIAS